LTLTYIRWSVGCAPAHKSIPTRFLLRTSMRAMWKSESKTTLKRLPNVINKRWRKQLTLQRFVAERQSSRKIAYVMRRVVFALETLKSFFFLLFVRVSIYKLGLVVSLIEDDDKETLNVAEVFLHGLRETLTRARLSRKSIKCSDLFHENLW
jgi:hypothetical protein